MLTVAGRERWMSFEGLENIPASSYIWSQAELSKDEIPPLHAILFAIFRVVDCRFEVDTLGGEAYTTSAAQGYTNSYVDVAFGLERGRIAGVHRFSVIRGGNWNDEVGGGKTGESVRIEFAL